MAANPRIVEPPFYDSPLVKAPSGGQQYSQAWTEYHQTVADKLTELHAGVIDGSDAAAGDVGEYLTATASGVGLANNVAATVVSLSLTAGDWDVSGAVVFNAGAGTHNMFSAGMDGADTVIVANYPSSAVQQRLATATARYSGSAAMTANVVAQAVFTGTVTADATVRARRVR